MLPRQLLLTLAFCASVVASFAQAPVLTGTPRSVLVTVGQPLSVTVGASGGAPLQYRWSHNGQVIAGATAATLTIPTAAVSDSGGYVAEILNSAGSAWCVFRVNVAAEKSGLVTWGYNAPAVLPWLGNVVGLANGNNTYVLRADGSVSMVQGGTTVDIATSAVAISAAAHVLALRNDGTIVASGYNTSGQCDFPSGLGNVVAVAAGGEFSVALRADGSVSGWGNSSFGQTVAPAGTSHIIDLSAGFAHVLALKNDGTVVAWGDNYSGQCTVPGGLTDVVAVSAGSRHSLALKRDGTVVAWGGNENGESTVPADLTGVVQISAGNGNSLALKSDGSVVSWGANRNTGTAMVPKTLLNVRAVGSGTSYNAALVPVIAPQVVFGPSGRTVTAGSALQLSVAVSGTDPLRYVWRKDGVAVGADPTGRISGTNQSTLVLTNITAADAGSYTLEVSNIAGAATSAAAVVKVGPVPVFSTAPMSQIAQLGKAVSFSASATGSGAVTYQWRHNGAAITGATSASFSLPAVTLRDRGVYEVVATDSTGAPAMSVFWLNVAGVAVPRAAVVAWGNASTDLVSPPPINGPVSVSATDHFTLALDGSGAVFEWGENYHDQSSVPTGAARAVAVAAYENFAMALRADGTLATWGTTDYGLWPVPVGAANLIGIAAGPAYALAVRSDGTLLEWGGRDTSHPVNAGSVSGIAAVAAGYGGVLALRSNGTILALRQAIDVPLPVGLTDVVAVAVGATHYLALKGDGTVVGWGTGPGASVPASLSGVIDIAANGNHSLAVKADGTTILWGDPSDFDNIPTRASLAVVASIGASHAVAVVGAKAPEISTQPASATAVAGTNVTLSVSAVGVVPLSYQWRKDGAAVTDGGTVSGATSSTLRLTSVNAAAAGAYTVAVSDSTGTIVSSTARVSVIPSGAAPTNDSLSAAQTLSTGSGTTTGFNVGASGETGEPQHGYVATAATSSVWYTWTVPTSGFARVGVTGLDFQAVVAAYAGDSMSALTLLSQSTASAVGSTAWVGAPVHAGDVIRIAVASATAMRGSFDLSWSLTVAPANDDFAAATVLASGTGSMNGTNTAGTAEPGDPRPALSTVWYKWTAPDSGKVTFKSKVTFHDDELKVFSGQGLSNLTLLGSDTGYPGFHDSTVIVPVTIGTTYFIEVASTVSNTGTFTLSWDLQTVAKFTAQPSDQTTDVGGAAALSVTTQGGGVSYRWFHDGQTIAGATSATLSFSNLQRIDAGEYYVVATNLVGSAASATVKIAGPNPAPTITTQPTDAMVSAGSTVSLGVTAAATGALSYQWRRNGVPIADATAATFTLTSACQGDEDVYDVAVFDGLSRSISRTVRLAVAPRNYPSSQLFAAAPLQPERLGTGWVDAIASSPTGDFYVAGEFDTIDGHPRSKVARFKHTGALDSTFTPPWFNYGVRLVVPIPDGGAYVIGDFSSVAGEQRTGIVRLTAAGALDRGFVSAVAGSIYCAALDANGKLIVGGSLVNNSLQANIYRLRSDGSIDPAFTGAAAGDVRALAVQPDGGVVIGGSFASVGWGGVLARRALARVNPDGTPDPTFDASAAVTWTAASAVRLLPGGEILVAGNGGAAGSPGIARLTSTGVSDTTFVPPSLGAPVQRLAVQASGRIVVMASDGSLLRLEPNGTVDTGFSPRSVRSGTYCAAIEADDSILWGLSTPVSGGAAVLGRWTADGAADSTVSSRPGVAALVVALAHAPGGKMFVAGSFRYFGAESYNDFVRLNADGSVDRTFVSAPTAHSISALVPNPDGSLFVVGDGVQRVLANGSIDTGFNAIAANPAAGTAAALIRGGRLLVAVPGGLVALRQDGSRDPGFDAGVAASGYQIKAIAVQSDARIVVGGSFATFNAQARKGVVRLNGDGSVDDTFQIGTGFDGPVASIRLLPDGKLLVGGAFSTYRGVVASYVARLNADGTLDATFVSSAAHPVRDMVPQSDGKVIVLSDLSAEPLDPTERVVRLNANGSKDTSWLIRRQTNPVAAILLRDDGQLWSAVTTTNVSGAVPFALAANVTASVPTITGQPQSVDTSVGASVSFSVNATGTDPLDYQWQLNGVPLRGATTRTLALNAVSIADAGAYSVTVTNEFGSATSNAALLKGPAPLPVIATQPASASVTAGQSVVFSIGATTAGNAVYQWRRDGVVIPGATNPTLNLSATSLVADGSTFDVVVSDGMSVTVSQTVRLSVAAPAQPQVASVDPTFDPLFDLGGALVTKVCRTNDGKIYVAGGFSRVGTARAWNLVRLTSTAEIDSTFKAAVNDGAIRAFAVQTDGRVVIAGEFSRIDGTSVPGLARLNADGTLDRSFAAAGDFTLARAIRVQADGKVLVGGGFTTGSGLVRLNADGSLDSSFENSDLTGFFYTLDLQPDGKIVAGGSFSGPSGAIFNRLARLNPDGALDTTFYPGAGPDLTVSVVRVLSDGRILVAGMFSTFDGATVGKITRVRSDGSADPTWLGASGFLTSSYDGGVTCLELQPDGRILASGTFISYQGANRPTVARLTADGALDATFAPTTGAVGNAGITYLDDGRIVAASGGGALQVMGSSGGSAAQVPAGSLFRAAYVIGTPAGGGKIMAAGAFSYVNGTPASGVVRLNADGTLDTMFSPPTTLDGAVRSLLVQPDGRPVVSGDFTHYNGAARPHVARLNLDGSVDTAFAPDLSSYYLGNDTRAYPIRRGRLLVYVNTTTQQAHFVRLSPDGKTETDFAAPFGGYANCVRAVGEQPDGRIIMVGAATTNASAMGAVARIRADGALDPSFNCAVDGVVNTVALLDDGRVLIGGDFLTVNQAPAPRIARLNADGSLDSTFRAGFGADRSVRKILLSGDGRILVSGLFTAFDGTPQTAFVARLQADGSVDGTFACLGLNGAPDQTAVNDDGSLLFSGGYAPNGVYQQYQLVRTVTVDGPIFVAQPQGAALFAGQTLRLTAKTVGGTGATYQWLKDGSPVGGATGSSFTVAAAQVADAGTYALRITSGTKTVTSTAATVSVAASAPILSTTPGRITGFGGAIAAGSRWPLTAPTVTAAAAPLKYEWFKNGAIIPDAADATLVREWQPADAGEYQVRISNSLGSATSQTFQQLVATTADWAWNYPSPQGNALATLAVVNGTLFGGGARGTIIKSNDGVTWTVHRLRISESVVGFAYGGNRYVALTSFGGIWVSSDAVTWGRCATDVTAKGDGLLAITYGGGRFVVVGQRGFAAWSSDGSNWAAASTNTTDRLGQIAFAAGKFIAAGEDGRTFTSTDGAGWTPGTTFPQPLVGLASGAGRFVAMGATAFYGSTDGTTWGEVAPKTSASGRALQWAGDGFVALFGDGYGTSTDGMAWSFSPFPGVNAVWKRATAVTRIGSRFVAVRSDDNVVLTSDGAGWSRPIGATAMSFTAAAASASTLMVAGVDVASYGGRVLSTTDGTYWSTSYPTAAYPIYGLAYGNGRFVSVGGGGQIRTSADGSVWSYVASTTTRSLYAIASSGAQFIAVGSGGTAVRSNDGLNWSTLTTGVTVPLYRIAYGGGMYLAVGGSGTVIRSTDMSSWTSSPISGIASDLYGVAYGAGRFVVVSAGGSIRSSTDGVTWTASTNPLSAYGLAEVAYANGRFYAFISSNTDYLTSDDGLTWSVAQHGSANASVAAVSFKNRLYLAGAGATIISTSLSDTAPTFTAQPSSQSVLRNGNVTLVAAAGGTSPLTYQWYRDGAPISGATAGTFVIANVTAAADGTYTVTVANAAGTVTSQPARISVIGGGLTASQTQSAASKPGFDRAFTIEGSAPKQMLLRAVGPGLMDFGVTDAASDPTLTISDLTRHVEVASNDNWGDAANAAEIAAVTAQAGAYPLVLGGKDAAILATLNPGTYQLSVGPAGTTGVCSVEIYEVDSTPRLVYVATRAEVGTGARFVQAVALSTVSAGRNFLVRALGPSLGLDGASDPRVTVYSGSTVVAQNDNWNGDAAVSTAAAVVGAMPLAPGSRDAALCFAPVADGVYNIEVTAPNGDAGAVLLEVFEADAMRRATLSPQIAIGPRNVTVNAGAPVSFAVAAVAKPQPSFQWTRNGTVITGATACSYSIQHAQVGDAGTYAVTVANGSTDAVTASAVLSVNPANNAEHQLNAVGYVAGSTITVTNQLYYVGSPSSVGWSVTVPAGWTLAVDTSNAATKPAFGAGGTLTWNWAAPSVNPVTFTYTLNVPVAEAGQYSLAAAVTVGTESVTVPALAITPLPPFHSADVNHDNRISLLELTRVIELYNARNGSMRTGCYRLDAAGEDGFATDAARAAAATVSFASYHTADSNRDGKIGLLELTRAIELYNFRFGSSRTGEYHRQLGTEDGFAPGP